GGRPRLPPEPGATRRCLRFAIALRLHALHRGGWGSVAGPWPSRRAVHLEQRRGQRTGGGGEGSRIGGVRSIRGLSLRRDGRVGCGVGRDRLVHARGCPALPPRTPSGRLEALLRSGGGEPFKTGFPAFDHGTPGRRSRPWRERGDRSLLSRRPFGPSHRRFTGWS